MENRIPKRLQDSRLIVLLLWHMHQPDYVIPGQNRALLPWVRLHALKDYLDMPALLSEFATVHATFNLVPSLLRQLQAYSQHELTDLDLELSCKAAVDLTKEDRIYLLRNFFSVDWIRILQRFPRLAHLLKKRGKHARREDLPAIIDKFTFQDFLDLQVLYNLAWSGNLLMENPTIRALTRKERGFTEDDKKSLFKIQKEFIGRIIPAYQKACASGQVEISTSPFYHPILPLLISTDQGRESNPHMALPALRFQHKEDAQHQIEMAIQTMESEFGFHCSGMWPSEGSVAEALAPLWQTAGIRWIASDEEILWNSLRHAGKRSPSRHELYAPYCIQHQDASVAIFFRDHELSDLLGFSYSRWKPQKAGQDFIERLLRIADSWKEARPAAVSVILDGENAWEHYEENGRPFLREFYGRLASTPGIATATFGEYLQLAGHLPILSHLHPGSWIYGNFNTWIGHPEKNRGWEELARARQVLADCQSVTVATGADFPAAKEAIYRAEGSDWFWWYGDDHASEHKEEFDFLFRANLQAVYNALGKPIPIAIQKSLRLSAPVRPQSLPTVIIHPAIDGRVSHFFEWRGSGAFQVRAGGAMQQIESLLDTVYFGYDYDHLYYRVDFRNHPPLKGTGRHLILWIKSRENHCLALDYNAAERRFCVNSSLVPLESGRSLSETAIKIAYAQVLEIAVPAGAIGTVEGDSVQVCLELLQNDRVLERWPPVGTWEFRFAPIELDQDNWYI